MPFSDEQQGQLDTIQDQEKDFAPQGPGDPPAPSKVTAKVVPLSTPAKPISAQGLSPDAIDRVIKGTQEGTSGIKQDIPDKLPFQPKAGQDNYLLRAQDQGFMNQLAKTAGNLIPNVAADMIDMVGQVGNINGTLKGSSDYDSGGFGKLATAIRDPFGEVYREHPDKTFDLGDSAWWLQNIAGFVQGAASFVLPGEGEAAAFSALGKMATEAVGAGRMGIEATQALGHGLSAFGMGYLMSAGSGKKVYDQAYATNYDRFIRQGYDPGAADDQAKQMASEGAARTVQIGTLLNGILNLTALAPLFKETPQAAMQGMFKGGEGALKEGESLSDWSQRLKAMSPEEATEAYRHGLTSHGFQAFQVGLQGLNTEYAEKHGLEVGTGQSSQLDSISDYFDKVTDQEGGLNMLSGLLGGLTQNILMDRVPLHSIVKIDPTTNKPLYKDDPNLMADGAKVRYQTELVSARTRDMMNNRQYFSSIRDAVAQDVSHIKSIQDLWQQAKEKGDLLNADRYRRQLTQIGDLNAITMGMTDSWQRTYQMMAEQNPDHREQFTEAAAQLKDLQAIHDRIADKFAPYQQDPDMGRLQDHIFNQEANHYLMGKAIAKEEGLIVRDENILGPIHQYNNDIAVYGKVKDKIDADVQALNKAVEKGDHVGMAKIMQKYGVNAYDQGDLRQAATSLRDRLSARADTNDQRARDAVNTLHADTGFADWEKVNPGKSLTEYLQQIGRDYPVDDRLTERKAILEKAKIEHEEMARNLAELNSKRGSDRFIKAVQKNAADWQEHLDQKAAASTENLFLKQQDKETAAKLDKNQQIDLFNKARAARLANDVKSGLLRTELEKHQADMARLNEKKGFFKHFTDLSTKKDLRTKIASLKAGIAQIDLQNTGHDKTMAALQQPIQDSTIKEDTARNAHREDVQNDIHSQQDQIAPTVTQPQPDSGIPSAPIPESVSRPAEDTYASLRESLAPRLQTVLDNLEYVMPDGDDFHRDLVYNAFFPHIQNQEISEERVADITEKMKDWWDEKKAQVEEPVPQPSAAPIPDDAILAQDNQVSDIPEPDSPLISYNAALNADNMDTAQIFQEVGAKATTAMKINSRSIEYMRVEKAGSRGTVDTEYGKVPVQIKHISFLPMYDKLDPTFNRNLLKPGFVSVGDPIHFQVDTDWNGQVTLDKADAPDEYGMPTTRGDSFSDYATPEGKIIMTKQAADLEPPFANAPIKIIHSKSGETLGYLPRVDWVTAKRPDTLNYRNIEDNPVNEDGTRSSGNVDAQRAKLLAIRATIAQAHNEGREEPVRTHISDTGPGHLFLSTDVNVNTEKSKLVPKLAKTLLPDTKLKMAILDKGTMMIGHGVPHSAPANFDAKSLREKYQTAGEQWNNTPMVLLPMPNGKVSESPLFTRKLEKRPADIHTIAKAIESYLAHGTAAETDEHRGIIEKLNQHTGYDITTEGGLRSFINQYYTYTQSFNEVHTRSNAETTGPKTPRFMLDIPGVAPGESKAAIKVGTSFSGSVPIYALTRAGQINPEFDQSLRDGLTTHYKNVVYTSQDIKGINDSRPLTAVTIQRDGKIRTEKFDNYNEYLKSFASTSVYGLHQAGDGTYLYGANPITEFDFREAVQQNESGAEVREADGGFEGMDDELIRQMMMNNAVSPNRDRVDYQLKVVDALSKISERMFTDFFQKDNKEKFYSELLNHGANKDQVNILRDWNDTNNPQSIGEMAAGIAAEMSYTVEIKTATETPDIEDYYAQQEWGQSPEDMPPPPTPEELNISRPTSHYSQLTAPGGTNYRENEIRTPDITPVRKGHAAFSTENGIGWFRSDDRVVEGTGVQGKFLGYWDSESETMVEHPRVDTGTPTKTRRILEIQSDLFQKHRNDDTLIASPVYTAFGKDVFKNDGTIKDVVSTHDSELDANNEAKRLTSLSDQGISRAPQNKFLQLLNKGNNWATFFTKAIVQDSIKKGYEEVMFPTGGTAARIEGHERVEDFIAGRERMIKELQQRMDNPEHRYNAQGHEIYEQNGKYYRTTEETDNDPGNVGVEITKDAYLRGVEEDRVADMHEMDEYKRELQQAREGTMKTSAIANFYEKTIHNILKKQGYSPERITDEHGNDWHKVKLTGSDLARGMINMTPVPGAEGSKRLNDYTQHSGGAVGSDSEWARIGKEFGLGASNHYWYGKMNPSSKPADKITEAEYREGVEAVKLANQTLKRQPQKYMNLLARNWKQVKKSEEVFAIGQLASKTEVKGGTGWAVQMAIDAGKPVHIYDQRQEAWFDWDAASKTFQKGTIPILTKDFAGIGTRQINDAGRIAIWDVYRKSTSSSQQRELARSESPSQPMENTITRDNLIVGDKGRPLAEDGIADNINKLYDEAGANPEQAYHLDIPGAGRTRFRLADGSYMTHFKLAQMLNTREIPYNIRLGDDIRSALENTPRRFLNSMMFEDDSMYEPLGIDDKILGQQLDNTFVPVRGDDGSHTGGYFSPERQEAVVDSVVKAISLQLDRRPMDQQGKPIKVGDYMNLVKNNVFANLGKIYQRIANGETIKGFDVTAEQGANLSREFKLVLNSFEPHAESLSFWGEALKKLDGLGIRVKESGRPAVPDGNEEVMKEVEGAGVRDWFDSHFEQNPMDSASSRIKMFIASTTDSTVGSETPPPSISLSFTDPKVRQDIVKGTKLFTTRTPEQAKSLGLDKPGAEAITKVDGKEFRVTAMGPLQEGDVHAPQIGLEEKTEPKTGDMKLQLTPWKPKPEQLIPNRNYLGLPKLADYEQLYEDAMASLGDTPRDLNSYIAKLKDDGLNGRPNLYALATNLEKVGPQTQNEFVSVMTLHYQPFTMILADAKTDGQGKPYYVLRPINANRASQLNTLVDHWQQSQKFSPILHKDTTGTTVVDKTFAQQLKTELYAVNHAFNTSDKGAPNQAKELLRKTLESNGIVLPEKGLDSLITGTLRWTQKTSLAGDFRKQFAVTEKGEAQGLVSAFILRLAGEGSQEDMLDSASDKSFQLNNPLYMEGTAMKVLARVAAAYTPNLYSNTHRSSDGKSIYDWGLPHKLSNDFNKLKSNEQWRAQFQDSDFAKRSWLLEHVANNAELRDRAGLSYLDGIRAAYGKQDSGTTRPAMSDREQLLTAVGLFQNGYDNRYAHYLSLTHSDRSTTPVFMNMPRIPVVTQMKLEYDKLAGTNTPRFVVHDEVIKRLYDVFLSEYDRINKASQVIDKEGGYNDERYEKGSQHFFMLPQFNHDRMQELVKDGRITEADFNSVWMMGDKKLNVLEGRGFKEAVDKMLRQHVEDLMSNTVKEWTQKGIVDGENTPFDRKYINKLLSHVGIYSNKDGTYRTRENQAVPAPYITKLSAQLAARDYAVNSYLFNTSLSQVFYGDPAQNFKGTVEKTMVEYGKRLTQFISPRKEGNWDHPTYQSVTVKDFTTKADYLGELSKAYKDINATDAQELTTVQEKLDVLRAYGRIPQQTYLEMSKIIKDAKGGYYEFTKPEHLDVVMQPEKPLYSGSRPPLNGAILNDYVKSSAYALYPPLLAGKELDSVRTAMEKGGIARLNFESAKKVGIPAKGIQLFDNNGRVQPGVFDSEAWKGTDKSGQPVQSARQELSRDNFGLSQEVPYDETKGSIRTVSQMNKLITEAIPTIQAPFDYKGEKLTGAQLSLEKENIRKQLIDINQQKLMDETGATINDDGNLVIKDKQKIYDALLKHANEQGGYSPNDLAILQHVLPNTDDLIVPLMYSPNASKFENLVMSMVNGITDIYIPGKSYVQASSAGQRMVKALGELSDEERKNIIHVGDYSGGELKMLHKDAEGKIVPAQVILPFNFQIKGRSVPVEDYVTTDADGRRTIDLSRVPNELLQVVSARIPNSGHNLMLPMQIVAFVPSNMGDLAIVPDAITRQMGSDFDVDKLYTYRRGYKAIPPPETSNTEAQHGNMQADHAFDMWDTGNRNGTPESKEAAAKVDEQIIAGEKIGGGESLHDVADRVLPKFRDILANAPDGTVIVTHSSVIKVLEQWDAEGRKASNAVDPEAYVKRSTSTGDEIPFKSAKGTVWVVRHGETTDNQAGKFRTPEAPLTDKGVRQSKESGKLLKSKVDGEIPEMYTSTMPRAIHSGNLINEQISGRKWAFEQDGEGEAGLKNDYFETHWSVLTNPDMTNKILSPLDKEDLKDEASQIEKWESRDKTKMSFYDPVYQLRDFQSQKDAKRLVGASSLSVTFNSVIQDKGLTIGYLAMEDGRMVPENLPIEIIDEDGKTRELSHLSGYGQSEYRKDGEKQGQMRTKNDNHVMQQAEFLDYSKNRISDKVHLTVQSYPASAALTQLQEPDKEGVPGWAPSIKYNARLLSQPIIQEYSQEMAKSQDTFSEDFDPDRKNTIMQQLVKKYMELGKIDRLPAEGTASFEDLTDALKKGPAQKDYYLKQIQALNLFRQLEQVGTQMMTAQNTINQDVNGAGPNLLTTMGKDYTRSRLETPLFSSGDRLAILQAENLYTRPDGVATEQGHLYDTAHQAAYGIAGEFFPYQQMKPLFDFVMEHTNRDDLSVDMQKSIFNSMKSYLFSHPKLGLWSDPVATRAKLLYGDSLAKRILEAKNTWGKNDLFLQRLQPDIDPDGLRPDYVKYQASKITKLDMDENTRHWVDLLISDDPMKAQLGHDLVRYAYLTGGIQDSQSFIKFLPYSFLLGTDFGHKLRELTGQIKDLIMAPSFRTQVFQHNPQIAKNMSPDFRETGGTYDKYPERFSLPAINPEAKEAGPARNMIVRVLDTDGKRRDTYPDFVSHYSKEDGQWILYRKMSLFNGSENGVNYARIDTLGDANTDEYSFTDGLSLRSLIPQNRSKAYDNIEPAYRMLNSAITNGHGAEVLRDFDMPRSGGSKELSEVLAKMALEPSVPEHNQVLSSWLSTIHEQNGSAAEALSHIYGEEKYMLPSLKFQVVRTQEEMTKIAGSPWAAAVMDSFSNRLYIGEEALDSKARLVENLNHELIHYHTASILGLGEDQQYLLDRHKGSLDTLRYAKRLYGNIIDKNMEIHGAIEELHKVRRQALDEIKKDMLQRGMSFEQEYDKVNKQGRIESDWHRRIYATSSNTEFVSHALTDINFMRYLNGKDASPKGMLGRVTDIVKRLMGAVANALGVDVRKGSLLEHAIDKSMAIMVQGRAGSLPDADSMASVNNMEPKLNMSNAVLASPTLTAMDRLAGKLQEQHDEISNSLTGRLTKADYSEKRTKLDQIETDIQALRENQSFQIAAAIGARHLGWVKDVLEQDKPTASQIMTANRVLEVWGNLIPLVYGGGEGTDEPDPAFTEIAGKAQDLDFKMLRKSEQALIDLSDGTLTMKDYSPERLQDISKDQALMRDVVSAAGSKVTQYVGTLLQTTARQTADDITRLVKETRSMEEAVASQIGGKGNLKKWYEQFFQDNKEGNAWGLVQRFSQNWYDFRREQRGKRNAAIKRIEEGGGDLAQKAQMKAQTWAGYWKNIDASAVFADTRKLFDSETGERKEDDAAKAHIAELEKHTDPETTKELVNEAQVRYRQYLDHKEPYFDALDAEQEAGTKTPEEVKRMKDDFVNKWSPNAFFANRNSKFGISGGSDYYAKMAPKRAAGEFYDKKFEALKQDPVASKYYTWLIGKMEELKSSLPVKVNDEHLGANFFPVVKRSLVTDMLDIPEYVRTMGERMMHDLSATEFEEAKNASTFRQIPIDYVNRDQKATPLNTRSKDIPRVIEAFGMMAMHYKHFSDARDSIDMGEAIIQKLDEARAAGATQMNVGGKLVSVKDGLKNTLDALRYMKDYLIYRKARKLEAKSDMKLYSMNPVDQIKTSNRVKELLSQRDKIHEQILNGEIDPEEGSKLIAPLDKELKEFDGRRIYGSKLGDKLISINQLKTLSYNPFSGLANMTFGVMSAGIHANGGRDFSWKELGSALKIMMHSTAKWASLGGKETHTADKILAVMDRAGVIGDVVDSHYGKIKIRDNRPAWRHAIDPFNWMKSGDYFMKGLTTVAMMLHDKVNVIENGEQKQVSVWEALDGDGKWNAEKYGENKSWYSEDVKEQKDWDKFRNKAVRVNMIIHGNQDKTSPKLANKFILGRLIGQFRMSWLPEGWYSRFQKEHFDIQLDREVKGRYRTIAQLGFGGYAMVTLKQLYSLVGKVDPYTNATRLDGKALNETDRENMRRNFAELAFVSTIMGAVVMTRAMAADSDDDKTAQRYRLLMNMLIRNKQDLEFYASPQVFDTMTRNIIPAATVLTDYAKALQATGKLIFNDDYQYQKWLLAMTHAGIPIPQATLINKTSYMAQKDLDNSPF